STVAQSLLGLVPQPGRTIGGQILFRDEDLLKKTPEQMRKLRGNRISLIFQDPMTSLNPVLTVGEHVSEPFKFHQQVTGRQAWRLGVQMLKSVGIPASERRAHDYPHRFSGGMRQRVMIATALARRPDLIVADEPTTALDVSIQAQILVMLREARQRDGAALVLITHNLGIVAELCDRAAVMYAGKIVEEAPVDDLFGAPRHPYTRALLGSLPRLGPRQRRLQAIDGTPPSLIDLPPGCHFAPRCPLAQPVCREVSPMLYASAPGHTVRCLAEEPRWKNHFPSSQPAR
ncbi:MAG: ABC transporter ATP-binding protein, partial [Chloroflexota bacterium]|nr:ABC transporter ATP-binding protein [Chloroflexota bacterium]